MDQFFKREEKNLSSVLLDHAKSFSVNGFKGPLLTLEMISDDDLLLINKEVWNSYRQNPTKDIMELYLYVFNNLGIMCPHPQMYRLYSGKKYCMPVSTHRYFYCEVCKCNVFNEMNINEKKEK